MSENATHIVVHHYIDGASNITTMYTVNVNVNNVPCLILIVVLVVCFFLGIVIYRAVSLKKTQRLRSDRSLKPITRQRVRHLAKNRIEDSSTYNDGDLSVSTQEFDVGADSNAQSIPMSSFRRHTMQNDDGIDDSSESSAGLYDVLFPRKHGGDIISEPPKNLVTFAGQVYATGERSSRTHYQRSESLSRTIAEPSTSGVTCDNATACGSLEWDYFQQDRHTGSFYSENESETESTVYWV